MEKRIILDGEETPFWLEDTGRLRNEKTKRWLKGGYNKGYHFYSLYFRGHQYILYTHRAVAEYFIPNDDPEKTIVHHLNGDCTNNNYLNLEWITPKEHNHTIKEMGQAKNKKEPQQKITNLKEYGEIAQFRDTPYYATKSGKILNMSKGIELKLVPSGNYLRFNAAYGIGKKILVHRAVWEAFNGPIPEGLEIDHIDGNPQNNSLDNLQAISHKENILKRDMDYSYIKDNRNFNR